MILLKVDSEGNTLRAELPSDELVDHLGSIGVGADIKVGGTDTVKVELFAEENNLMDIAVCKRLDANDRLTDLNKLCEKTEYSWRVTGEDFAKALDEKDVHGVAEMQKLFDEMDLAAKEEIAWHKAHDMDM